MSEIKKCLKRLALIAAAAAVLAVIAVMAVNSYVINQSKDSILYTISGKKDSLSAQEINNLKRRSADCILILGAGIKDDETPTPMLKDRLDTGIMLYKAGAAPKLLLSGDNGSVGHNEIHVMLTYVKKAGVPEKDIFCDHAGFSTYDSMYRAAEIFNAQSLIVVTQSYHEYRALYIGQQLGLEAVGVASDQVQYGGQFMRDVREVLARAKDFLKTVTKPEAELGGEVIPISGSGIISHGE